MAHRKNIANDAEAIINILNELEEGDELATQIGKADELEFVLHPPIDGAASDEDDAGSDLEAETADIRDLGKGVLAQPVDVRTFVTQGVHRPLHETLLDNNIVTGECHSVNAVNEPGILSSSRPKKRIRKRNWKDVASLVSNNNYFDSPSDPEPAIVGELRRTNAAPIDIFRLIIDDTLVDKMCRETVTYAMQKGAQIQVSYDDIYKYIAILLLSGYCKVPHRDMYWEQRPDTHNALVSGAMKRGPFREVHRYFHLNDNSLIDKSDRVYKVRPLITHLNAKFQTLITPLGTKFAIDEAMEPYYGHHYMKQFIRGKPIRYGFKFWCMNTPGGYLIKFEPYTGAQEAREPGQTLGTSVVRRPSSRYIPPKSTIYIDNYNSIPLQESLKEEGIYVVGTIRSDRIEHAPLKDLKKEPRGSYHVIHEEDSGITLVRWNDNSQVTIATNVEKKRSIGLTTCKRWNRGQKESLVIRMPVIIKEYNKSMGGVDLFDRLRGLYRIRIRNKRWYYPLVRFCLNGAMVNAWMLYRHIHKDMRLVEFIRRCVIAILATPAIEKPKGVRPKAHILIKDEVRYDNIGHLVDAIEKQRKCALCKKCTTFCCVKCNVGLHPRQCFLKYHSK